MKIYIPVITLIVAVFALFYILPKDSYEINKPKSSGSIIAFGDSLVSGVGSTKGNDFVSLLSKQLGEDVINAGVPGDTTGSAKLRLNDDVLSKNPRIVIVLLGGNDFLMRIPRQQTIDNLRMIISSIHSEGSSVVLVGVRDIIYSSDYKKLAQESGSVYVPNILDETYGKKELMADLIHPNDQGYKIFADKISAAMQVLLE